MYVIPRKMVCEILVISKSRTKVVASARIGLELVNAQ